MSQEDDDKIVPFPKKGQGKGNGKRRKPLSRSSGQGKHEDGSAHRAGVTTGRKPMDLDYTKIEAMAHIQCTNEEIAYVIGMTPEGFCRRVHKDPALSQAIQKGKAQGRMSLRRMQYQAAEKGNIAALIWLGKQILGQREVQRHEMTGADGGPITMDRIHEVSDAQLEEIISMAVAEKN